MLGPDGRPYGSAPLVGSPQSLADIAPLTHEEIKLNCADLERNLLPLLQSGTPLEIPLGVPLGGMAKICVTLRAQSARIQELEAIVAALPPAASASTASPLDLSVTGRLDLSRLGNL